MTNHSKGQCLRLNFHAQSGFVALLTALGRPTLNGWLQAIEAMAGKIDSAYAEMDYSKVPSSLIQA